MWAERADQKHFNSLPLALQFALTAAKLQMFGGKTRHVWHPVRTCFFVSCLRLDATDGIFTLFFAGQERFGVRSNWPEDQHNWYGVQLDRCWFCQEDKKIPEPLNLILILTMHDQAYIMGYIENICSPLDKIKGGWPKTGSWHRTSSRLQNSRFFFSKSVKKTVKRGVRVLRPRSARASHARRACEAREKKTYF